MNEIVFDAEFDGLNPTRMHCISYSENSKSIITRGSPSSVFHDLSTCTNDYYIGHNIVRYDCPQISRLFSLDLSKKTFIDTLALSWYLFPDRIRHGLDVWGEVFGFPKVEINDWTSLSVKEYQERCERDVQINQLLWDLCKKNLMEMYGTKKEVYRVCRYLTSKLEQARKAEESRFKLDVPRVIKNLETLEEASESRIESLKKVMPPVLKTRLMEKPSKLIKADNSLTQAGIKWYNILRSKGLNNLHEEPVEIVYKEEEPNPTSHLQIKEWLTSIGWKPETFKTNKKGIDVPQLSKLDRSGLCDSVIKLVDKHEEIKHLSDLFVLQHRIGVLKGFLSNEEDGYVKADIVGFTNTLRMRHGSPLVNLPSVFSEYGEYIRPCLIAREGKVLCGSDMSGLEDRTKQNFMIPYDPKYVKEMNVEGFDPHLDIALLGGLMTKDEVNKYKNGEETSELKAKRHGAKTTNYSCTYGAYPPKIAKTAGIPLEEAKTLWETYWKRNWSIEEIAKNTTVREYDGKKWQWNPISNLWYYLKYDKDRFSTLNQGTGSFCFDLWVGYILRKRPQINAQFHDEVIIEINESEKEEIKELLSWAIEKVNKQLELKRRLDVDVQFGGNYGEIH